MAGLLGWLKDTSIRLVDPRRENRLQECADALNRQLFSKRDRFDLDAEAHSLQISPRDLPETLSRTYAISVRKVWSDLSVTDKERAALTYVAKALRLDAQQAREIETKIGIAAFGEFYLKAIADGRLNEEEKAVLDSISAQMSTTTTQLMQVYFAKEGEGFLRNLFSLFCRSGVPEPDEWQRVIRVAEDLGTRKAELLALIKPQAEQYVEHILADAKSDELLGLAERNQLGWCLENFDLSPQFRSYAEAKYGTSSYLRTLARDVCLLSALPICRCERARLLTLNPMPA